MTKTTIYQTQIGLLIRNGSVVRELGAGTYKTSKFRNETITIYPAFRQAMTYTVQARTVDAAQISVTITVGAVIENVGQLYTSGMTVYEVISRAITRQIQDATSSVTLEQLLEKSLEIDVEKLNSEITEYGLVATLELAPSIHLPRNLQNAIDAQEVARQKAKAELEEARGRTAVIRHYANVAKVTQDNPDLLRLLLGQKAKAINVAFDAPGKAGK